MVLGAVICTAAQNVATLIVGRFFIGLAAFSLIMGVMLWNGEISPKAHRGFIAGMSAWGGAWGFVIAA